MNATKTGLRPKIALPVEMLDILRWHVDNLPEGPLRESDLRFPRKDGGFAGCAGHSKPEGLSITRESRRFFFGWDNEV